jgi:hypothetical protein
MRKPELSLAVLRFGGTAVIFGMRNHALASAVLLGVFILAPVHGKPHGDRMDAVIAAPTSHSIILENSRVRVLQVTIPPGGTEPAHTHAWPSVMRFESPQPLTYITYSKLNGKLVEGQRFEVPMENPGRTEWTGPEGFHAVQNRGTSQFRAIRIELKPSSPSADQKR